VVDRFSKFTGGKCWETPIIILFKAELFESFVIGKKLRLYFFLDLNGNPIFKKKSLALQVRL